MSGSLRGAVPGQLCLLELLEHLSERNDPPHPNNPDDPNGDAARSVVEAELREWERALLRFAVGHHLTGRYAERVEQQLGCSATRYLQALAGMLDRPEVLAAQPEFIGRLRALRDRRRRLRALGRGSR